MGSKIGVVLVPASGGPAGVNTIKSLTRGGFSGKIVATDADALSAGFFLANKHAVMPLSSDEDAFFSKLTDVVRTEKVELLMPTSQTDGYVYSKRRLELEKMGAFPVISGIDAMETCIDKLKLYNELSGKFDVPATTTDPDEISDFPVLAKPRYGKGSRDIFKLDDETDLAYRSARHKDMLYQEFLPGTEYTVDVLSDLDGNAIVAVPRIRLETRGGISSKGRVVRNRELQEECMRISESIGILGPCCIQMKESKHGRLKLVEVNPRLGGGTIFSTLAGANFPKMIVELAEGKKISAPEFSEVTIVRYFEEIVVPQATKIDMQIHSHPPASA